MSHVIDELIYLFQQIIQNLLDFEFQQLAHQLYLVDLFQDTQPIILACSRNMDTCICSHVKSLT